jgi:hypothetical protein
MVDLAEGAFDIDNVVRGYMSANMASGYNAKLDDVVSRTGKEDNKQAIVSVIDNLFGDVVDE